MVSAVQVYVTQTKNFTYGHATMNTIDIKLPAGETLIINKGFNNTIFVKSGTRPVNATRILNLKLGQTAIVHSIRLD